ncbi:Uncharacterized protein F54H12.2 [Eumeta japonica]|uniref:Uncharacterized protein F54H12.2 n=1 Tax=Eumeta variegata TaxID=151549 RepID=A0A4C1UQM8_EUMVA|nr:Uncharacterized protein F54H12.2 [Eumeta japonica]
MKQNVINFFDEIEECGEFDLFNPIYDYDLVEALDNYELENNLKCSMQTGRGLKRKFADESSTETNPQASTSANANTLLQNKDKIYWKEEDGTVIINKETVPGTNIVNLINDVLRPLKRSEPIGWEQFATILKEINVPITLIGNPNRRVCPYENYYSHQAGSGVGIVYKGAALQRGHGIGGFLGGVLRSVLPLLSNGIKAVGKELLSAGVELDLFALPSTQTSIESGQWVHYKPISSLSDDGPIEFNVPGTGDDYIDLSHTLLHIKAKVITQDGSTIAPSSNVAPVNNWLHSLFSQLDVYLNQKLISPPNNTYAYRAYIETLLNYGPAAKESHLTCSLWYEDSAGKMNKTDSTNTGYYKRAEYIKTSKEVEMVGHLHGDLFGQEKFLINGVQMSVKLVRSRESFNLMSSDKDAKFKVRITDATLLIRRARINPSILLAHQKKDKRAREPRSSTWPSPPTDTSPQPQSSQQCVANFLDMNGIEAGVV